MQKNIFKVSIAPLLLSAVIVFADQLTKMLAVKYLAGKGTGYLIDGILEYYYLHNYGVAYGMFQGGRWFFVAITGVAVVALICGMFVKKINSCRFMVWMFSLIIGGGIGNLIDRIRLGYVIDFVRFPVSWFHYSFNLADAAVVCGGVALMFYFVIDIFKNRKKIANNAEEKSKEIDSDEN